MKKIECREQFENKTMMEKGQETGGICRCKKKREKIEKTDLQRKEAITYLHSKKNKENASRGKQRESQGKNGTLACFPISLKDDEIYCHVSFSKIFVRKTKKGGKAG